MFPRRGYRRGGYGRQPGLAMLLLGVQLMQVGFNRIPPVTLAAIIGQVVIFLNPMHIRLPSTSSVCISAVHVWYKEEWQRLLMAAFFHLNEWHLYYNMVSFLWKGLTLERKLSSTYFAYMIGVFALVSNSLTVGLAVLAENVTGDPSYLSQCAAGFSGVLFALKVVTTHLMPAGTQRIMGLFPVHSRIACWVELLVIHILVPNSSFIGHLSGILVGLLYVKGPLKYLMDQLHSPGPSYTYHRGTTVDRPRGSATYNFSGTTGGERSHASTSNSTEAAANSPNPSMYTAGLSEEEQIRRATEESLYSAYTQQRLEPSAPLSEADLPHATPQQSPTLPPSKPSSSQRPTLPPSSTQPPILPPSYESLSAPPYSANDLDSTQSPNRMYPDLSSEQPTNRSAQNINSEHLNDLRQRRLARFDK